jgi:hypothetical protein
MSYLVNSSYVLKYFFKLITHTLSEARFYSEKFLFKAKNIRGIIFFFLKFISNENECEETYIFSVIFLKNLFNLELKKDLKKEKYITINCLVDISASCSTKLINVLSEIIFHSFQCNLENSFVIKFLINNINQKLSGKIFLHNKHEFFYSILIILEKITKLISNINSSNDFTTDYLKLLEKTLKNIFFFVGKISILNPSKLQLKVLILLTNLFKIINTYILITCLGEDLDNWLLIFLFILDNTKNKDNLFDVKLELKENILNCMSSLSLSYQNEFSIYLPILCNQALHFSNLKINKKLFATIELLESIFISTNSLIIFRNNNFEENLRSLLLQIISNHIIYLQKIYEFPIFVFSNGNFNFLKRLMYGNMLVNSVCIKKRKIIFNYPNLFFQTSVFDHLLLYMLPIVFSVIYSVINGTFLKGIFVTYCLPNIKILFNKLYINYENIQENKNTFFFIDFISFYRYQLPIKLLSNTINLLFDLLVKKEILYSHFLSCIERILNIRGNNENGILLFYYNKVSIEQIFISLIKKTNLKNFTFMTKINIKKLFMRMFLNQLINKETHEDSLNRYILGEFIKLNDKNYIFFSIFDFEIINLKICLNKTICKDFLHGIIKFGICILSENQTEMIPYVLDIFVSLIETERYASILPIFVRIFKGLLNPHIWQSNFLVKSLLRYLRAFILNTKHTYSKYEVISLCCIIQTIIDNHIDKEYFFYFLISFLNIFDFQINLFPHFLELFTSNQYFLKKQSKYYLYLFTVFLVGKIGFNKMMELCDMIQKNFFIYILEKFSCNFIILKKNRPNKDIFYQFFEIFIDRFLTNNIIFLKKIIGKIFRQIIFSYKIFENEINLIDENNFESSFRFKKLLFVNNKYSNYNHKSFFLLDKLIRNVSLFLNVSINLLWI